MSSSGMKCSLQNVRNLNLNHNYLKYQTERKDCNANWQIGPIIAIYNSIFWYTLKTYVCIDFQLI
jgi:hypothetical protein